VCMLVRKTGGKWVAVLDSEVGFITPSDWAEALVLPEPQRHTLLEVGKLYKGVEEIPWKTTSIPTSWEERSGVRDGKHDSRPSGAYRASIKNQRSRSELLVHLRWVSVPPAEAHERGSGPIPPPVVQAQWVRGNRGYSFSRKVGRVDREPPRLGIV
jgi:hypothetical protein